MFVDVMLFDSGICLHINFLLKYDEEILEYKWVFSKRDHVDQIYDDFTRAYIR